jgi:Tautomerase enzyme
MSSMRHSWRESRPPNGFSGRSLQAKKALYRAIVDNLGNLGIPADHIKVLCAKARAEN